MVLKKRHMNPQSRILLLLEIGNVISTLSISLAVPFPPLQRSKDKRRIPDDMKDLIAELDLDSETANIHHYDEVASKYWKLM